jgi:hypothetical protein
MPVSVKDVVAPADGTLLLSFVQLFRAALASTV